MTDHSHKNIPAEKPRRDRTHKRDHLWRDPFLLALIVLAAGKAALMRYLALGDRNFALGIGLELAGIVLLLGIVDLLPRRRNHIFDLMAFTFLSAVMFANTLYINYYDQLFDPRMLAVARQVTTVGDVIGDLLGPVHLLFVIDIPLLTYWALQLRRASYDRRGRREPRVAIAVALAIVAFAAQSYVVTKFPHDVDGLAASDRIGLGVFQVVNTARGNSATDKAIAAETEEATARTVDSTMTAGESFQKSIEEVRKGESGLRVVPFEVGAYKGSNVILVQVEAFQTLLIDKKIGGAEITPNFNDFAKQSIYLPNTYSQTGAGNTSDAEFISNTGLLPLNGQAAAITYTNRELTSLPRLLKEDGYATLTMHQNEVQYWNRAELYEAIGFDRYYDKRYFKDRDRMWRGSSDEVLFEDGAKVLQKLDDKGVPFYAQMITLSSHTPFTYVPANRRPLQLPKSLRGSIAADYVTAESYTDKAFGEFVEGLKRSGLWDNSIVVVYGDHMSLKTVAVKRSSGDPKIVMEKLLGRNYGAPDYQRVPLMIHLPGQEHQQVITGTTAMADIMPTVADLLGVDLSGTPHVGRSAFTVSDGLVPLRAYYPVNSFVNDRMVVRPGMGIDDANAWTLDTCQPTAITEQDRLDYERSRKLSDLSAAWVSTLPVRPDAKDPNDAYIPTDKKHWGENDKFN